MNEVGCSAPVSRKGYADLVHQLAGAVRVAHLKSEVYRLELAERDGKIKKLNLKVQLLADGLEKVARLRTQMTKKDWELTS